MLKEFKAFALRGNVIDLAVAVILGAAFGKIVSSFIDDVITPLILKPALDAAHLKQIEELTILGSVRYGLFLSSIINFLIVVFVLFIIVKAMNSMKRKEEVVVVVPETAEEIMLLRQIRDSLKK